MSQKQKPETWSVYQSIDTEVVLPDWVDFAVLHSTGVAIVGRRENAEPPRVMTIPGLDEQFTRLGPAKRPDGYRLSGHVNGADIMVIEVPFGIHPALTLIAQRDEPVAVTEAGDEREGRE
jgi:hypothetical protein